MAIHPTAQVDKRAEIDSSVEIGAYAIVEAGVKIAARTRLWPHAYVAAGTSLGEDCQIHPFAVVGHHPQDLGWKQSPSYTQIGDGTIVRELATIHRGTPPESSTQVGKRCFIMSTAHVGHNCTLGDDVKMANGALLSGWCQVGSGAFLSGAAQAQQFARIGELCMISGLARVANDVAPFMIVVHASVIGVNIVGLRRAGFSPAERSALRSAYQTLFRSGLPLPAALAQLEKISDCAPVRRLIEFLRAPSRRGLMRFRARADAGHEASDPDDSPSADTDA